MNKFIHNQSFKMEILETVSRSINPNNWMASLDLKDAYFHVPIHRDHHQFLRFYIADRCYQYKVPHFGLTTSPRVFMKVLAPMMGILR